MRERPADSGQRRVPGGSATKRRTAGATPPAARVADDPATKGTYPPAESTTPEPAEALATLVEKLRTELAGVRAGMRNRAVIEQAKGVLVERLRITPDAAFDQLVTLSQRANVKLVEIAAAIVGTTAPDPPTTPVTDLVREHLRAAGGTRPAARRPGGGVGPARRPGDHEALQSQHQLVSARIDAAATFDEVAEAVGAATAGWPAPATVVLTLLEPTGAHRFVGAYGMSAGERGAWTRVPPRSDVPITLAARDRAPLLVTDPELLAERFPVVAETDCRAVFAAPLLHGDRVVGALGLSWHEPLELSPDARRYLTALAMPAARKVAELAARSPAGSEADGTDADAAAWLPIVLETVPDPTVLLAPVWDDGRVVDFRVEYANAPAAELISPARAGEGATLLAIYPRIGSELLLPRLATLLHTGRPQRLGPVRLAPATGGSAVGRMLSARAGRVADRVVMTWRVHDESELIHPQLLDAERIARIGSFRWDLDSPEPRCSPQLYRMYFGDERPHPIRAGDLAGCVHADDLAAVQEAVSRTLVGGEQLSWEFRGAGRLAGRRLRIVAEPVVDAEGVVGTVLGTVQDVTDERTLESRLRLAEEAVTAQRRRVDAELHAAQALQRALLPDQPELGATEGLWVSGRGRSSDHTGHVDGDWYDACALPDGVSLLVVGDVAGSGLAAMTAAARLRYAVRSYAALDMSPGEILASVNTLLCALDPERTATLVVGRYESRAHRLSWAAAGQAAPVRYRGDGGAELLTGPLGLPVGVVAQATYEDATVELAPGDRLLLYTDSLVGGRGTDLVSALDVLLGAGAHAGRDDVEAVVSHVLDALRVGPGIDMGAMLVRVNG
ncbi:SpoIIE family protein phosphatase [Planosporangium sp. 12N6]|uniref:SpoIIE family protein phosphatase n=1 Tax=Planosporangium spinosum TaxID=3402278 RepID=UPI003CE90B0F